jgi:FdhD protein
MTGHRPTGCQGALSFSAGGASQASRTLAEETPVALVYNGTTQAVMMASPQDLEDFAVGFSMTEGIVSRPGEIESLEIVEHARGLEVRMWIDAARDEALALRRRTMAGPVGCGMCGIDSIDEALRPVPGITCGAVGLDPSDVRRAVDALRDAQSLHDQTHAVHAAGFWTAGRLVLAREDVGRHNALDKLGGAIVRADMGRAGAIVLTSRVSLDMVQKTAALGVPVLIAVSAPTTRAVQLAGDAGMTLVASARGDRFDVFTHPHRITGLPNADVA